MKQPVTVLGVPGISGKDIMVMGGEMMNNKFKKIIPAFILPVLLVAGVIYYFLFYFPFRRMEREFNLISSSCKIANFQYNYLGHAYYYGTYDLNCNGKIGQMVVGVRNQKRYYPLKKNEISRTSYNNYCFYLHHPGALFKESRCYFDDRTLSVVLKADIGTQEDLDIATKTLLKIFNYND